FLRPDIVNFDTLEIYEIKPLGLEGLGVQELQMYQNALNQAGVPVRPGRMGAPGTYGVVTSPDGGVFEYGTATPGLIVYQPTNLPRQIPEATGSRDGAPDLFGPAATVASAYLTYRSGRPIAISFGATPVAGAASLAVP